MPWLPQNDGPGVISQISSFLLYAAFVRVIVTAAEIDVEHASSCSVPWKVWVPMLSNPILVLNLQWVGTSSLLLTVVLLVPKWWRIKVSQMFMNEWMGRFLKCKLWGKITSLIYYQHSLSDWLQKNHLGKRHKIHINSKISQQYHYYLQYWSQHPASLQSGTHLWHSRPCHSVNAVFKCLVLQLNFLSNSMTTLSHHFLNTCEILEKKKKQKTK